MVPVPKMILTGPEISRAQAIGDISIQPFCLSSVNPNSYNYHLARHLISIRPSTLGQLLRTDVHVPDEGYLLEPGNLYLGATHERIGSQTYAITLLGRSSIGRLGIFLSATADLGHVGCDSNWTLEISVVQPVYIYPLMRIGQVAFWTVEGKSEPYRGRYHGDVYPEPSKDPMLGYPSGERGKVDDFVGRSN